MMTFKVSGHSKAPSQAYVWSWLPNRVEPVVAGVIARHDTRREPRYIFSYGRSYLERRGAVPLAPELPLRPGIIEPEHGMAGALRDASPDGWGRRVIASALLGQQGDDIKTNALDELTYLLESGSDRIGALDFQASPLAYLPRNSPPASLEELMTSAEKIEAGEPLHPDLDVALRLGSAIGGARPKALVSDNGRGVIVKFATRADPGRSLRAEWIAMRLAFAVGIDAAAVELRHIAGRDALLIERFDRVRNFDGINRLGMVSALTLLNTHESDMDDLSYADDFAAKIRSSFVEPRSSLHALYRRMVFNIICGNTDDHARNHAAFWDGSKLRLTPAYDIAPLMMKRSNTAADRQAMYILGKDRRSNLALCLQAAPSFQLAEVAAHDIITGQIETVRKQLPLLCDEMQLTPVERDILGNVMLHPSIFEGWSDQPSSDRPSWR
jgi:serine/threonine-protein kinase HipA